MSKDIRRGTIEQLWTNVEVGAKGFWTYAHFELNGVRSRVQLDAVSSRDSSPATTPFAEGEGIIASGEMSGDTFVIRMAYLPERNMMIPQSSWLIWLIAIPAIMLILIGLPCLYGAINHHADFELWLVGLTSTALGIYSMIVPFDSRATEKLLKATAQAAD